MDILLSANNLVKQFSGLRAVDDVSLQIEKGKSYCLIGENGSGKSTLIKLFSGVYKPTSGSITINDKTFNHGLKPHESIREGIDVIYQDFQLFPNLSVAENIMIEHMSVSTKPILNWKWIYRKSEEVLARLGLKFNLSLKVLNLSTADRQLVSIAKAIVKNAKCIIMDEATTALTQKEVDILFSIVRELNKKGVTTIFVSHKIFEVMEVAEHFIVLRNGKKVFDQRAEGVNKATLVSHMSGKASEESRLLSTSTNKKDILFEVRNLSQKNNFSDISFNLHKGEILGITGLIGSGVQPLATALFGLEKCDSGSVSLQREKIPLNNPSESLKKGIALVPSDRLNEGLHVDKPIEDNIVAVIINNLKKNINIDDKKKKKIVNDWINRLEIKTNDAEAYVQSLSGGNQQKVLVSKWLISQPKVLIFANPTVGVDIFSKLEIHKLTVKLAESGMGIIVISDDIPELYTITDRVLIMKHGNIIYEMDSADSTEKDINDILLDRVKV